MDSRHLAVVNAPHSLSKSIYSHQIRIVRSWMKLKLSPRGAHNECRKRLSMLQLRFHFDWLPAQRSQQRNETRKKPKTQSRSKIAQCTRCVAWRGWGEADELTVIYPVLLRWLWTANPVSVQTRAGKETDNALKAKSRRCITRRDRQTERQATILTLDTHGTGRHWLLANGTDSCCTSTSTSPLPLPLQPCVPACYPVLMSFINKPRAIASLVKFALAARTVDRQDIFVNKPLLRAWFVLLLPETVQPIPGSAPATVFLLLACLLHYNWVYDKSIAHKVFTVRVSSVCVNNLRSS